MDCVHVCALAHVCKCLWKPGDLAGVVLQEPPALFLEMGACQVGLWCVIVSSELKHSF